MAIVKGYYHTKLNEFLGQMVAKDSKTGAVYTPRNIEGICFGEYDTDTRQFTPLTNPVVIPKGTVVWSEEDQDAFINGKHKVNILSGIEEDTGADIARKQVFSIPVPQPVPEPEQLAPQKPKLILPVASKKKIDLDKLF